MTPIAPAMLPTEFRYDWVMWWGRAFLFVALVACTKSNPAKHCADGTCSDPSFPFCDVNGAVADEAGACISAACTADTFVECRDDVEVRCNVDGTNYNLSHCDRGCDAAADGCGLCDPGETSCTNGKVATCDASGTVTSAKNCPLGCFESEPRCREISPSNDLASYMDMVPSPPSATLEMGSFNMDTGEVTDNGTPVSIPSFTVSAPAGGVPLRVFVVDELTITQAVTTGSTSPGRALVILARGPITIVGRLGSFTGNGYGLTACNAGAGTWDQVCMYASSASGGGAFATNGGKGGDVVDSAQQIIYLNGGVGGIANGNASLVPLRGGCPSGITNWQGNPYDGPSSGGGAIHLVSSVRILVNGVIDVAGYRGYSGSDDLDNVAILSAYMGSGGAGGGILLEAPEVIVDAAAILDARGGAGASCSNTPQYNCYPGGAGAMPGVAATPGVNSNCGQDSKPNAAGAAGGGLGRIRINTQSGSYTKASSTVENGAVTAGTIETR